MRYQLSTRRACALGNGNRQAGALLASIELADGVTPAELVNAVLNLNTGVAKLSPYAPQPPAPETVIDDEGEASDPRKTPLDSLGLSKRIVKALSQAGLNTAGAIADEGGARGGLTHVAGVSERDEETIVAALKDVLGDEPPESEEADDNGDPVE